MKKILITIMSIISLANASEVSISVNRGNVRYGPSSDAPVAMTLSRGTKIEVLGEVEGKDGWYKISFPKTDKVCAWMNEITLEKTNIDGEMKVLIDGAYIRSDSRSNSTVVTQVVIGETIKLIKNKNGDWKKNNRWYAVQPPVTAAAYVYKSIINLTGETKETITKVNTIVSENDKEWLRLYGVYLDYCRQMQLDPNKAMSLDWNALSSDLQVVKEEHPKLRTKLEAQKAINNISRIVIAYKFNQPAPKVNVPPKELPKVKQTEPKTTPVKTKTPSVQDVAKAQKNIIEKIEKNTNALVGWLEMREFNEIKTKYILTGKKGIIAFVKLKPNSQTNLKELHWRKVIITGDKQIVSHEMPLTYKKVPLVIVDDIKMAR